MIANSEITYVFDLVPIIINAGLVTLTLFVCILSLFLLFRYAGRAKSQRQYLIDTVYKRRREEDADRLIELKTRRAIIQDELIEQRQTLAVVTRQVTMLEKQLAQKQTEYDQRAAEQNRVTAEIARLVEEKEQAKDEKIIQYLTVQMETQQDRLVEIKEKTPTEAELQELKNNLDILTEQKDPLTGQIEQNEAALNRINEAYEQEEKAIEEAATTFANSIIPSQWEEYGPTFYIEFGTVIVIIFALLALGVLEIIGGQEVATILAAIAGYVLGKTSRKASPTT